MKATGRRNADSLVGSLFPEISGGRSQELSNALQKEFGARGADRAVPSELRAFSDGTLAVACSCS